jgi:signal transduction histidine kinase
VATNRAEDALRIKSNFISEISHEIRTPLNILTGFTQIIIEQGHELDEAAKSDISRQITENTERITELVDKMLELSEVSSKTTIETPDDVSARQIAEEAVKDSAITEASHLDFNLQFADDVDQLILHTNLQAATRVLTLLLDNARKFTRPAESVVDHGPIVEKAHVLLYVDTVVDHLHPETASSSNVVERRFARFTVEDTGKGVPASEAERIFEKFVQLDDYYDGTGIGLTVARSLARSLGGDIVLDTTYTQGARFVMTIAVSPAGAK